MDLNAAQPGKLARFYLTRVLKKTLKTKPIDLNGCSVMVST